MLLTLSYSKVMPYMNQKSTNQKRALKEIGLFILDILYNAVVIIALVVLIRSFLISPFRVIGSSMVDTLHNNEFILIDKLSYHLAEPKRGDSIVFLPPITNKHSYKFKETIHTNVKGIGTLDISNLKAKKEAFFCRNNWVSRFWFCLDSANEGDLIYFQPLNGSQKAEDIEWENVTKKTITQQEVKNKKITIRGIANKDYLVRIYHSTGPEYYVKRIIGVPGDEIRIENGLVYVKPFGESDYIQIDESYLNSENKGNTYYREIIGQEAIQVPAGQYFVMGDNRNHSNDSRHWFSPLDEKYTPFVAEDNISGKVLIVLWPPQDLRLIPSGILQEIQ